MREKVVLVFVHLQLLSEIARKFVSGNWREAPKLLNLITKNDRGISSDNAKTGKFVMIFLFCEYTLFYKKVFEGLQYTIFFYKKVICAPSARLLKILADCSTKTF